MFRLFRKAFELLIHNLLRVRPRCSAMRIVARPQKPVGTIKWGGQDSSPVVLERESNVPAKVIRRRQLQSSLRIVVLELGDHVSDPADVPLRSDDFQAW